jgi:hypothetical protein
MTNFASRTINILCIKFKIRTQRFHPWLHCFLKRGWLGQYHHNSTCLYQVRVIMGFKVFRLLTDFVCLYIYEFWLSHCKIVRSSVILLLPLCIFISDIDLTCVCTFVKLDFKIFILLSILAWGIWNTSAKRKL